MQTMTVTTQMFKPGDVDETKYQAFYTKIVKSYQRQVVKAHAKNNLRSDVWGWTDEDCYRAARAYCEAYRHHFRVLVPVALPSAG